LKVVTQNCKQMALLTISKKPAKHLEKWDLSVTEIQKIKTDLRIACQNYKVGKDDKLWTCLAIPNCNKNLTSTRQASDQINSRHYPEHATALVILWRFQKMNALNKTSTHVSNLLQYISRIKSYQIRFFSLSLLARIPSYRWRKGFDLHPKSMLALAVCPILSITWVPETPGEEDAAITKGATTKRKTRSPWRETPHKETDTTGAGEHGLKPEWRESAMPGQATKESQGRPAHATRAEP